MRPVTVVTRGGFCNLAFSGGSSVVEKEVFTAAKTGDYWSTFRRHAHFTHMCSGRVRCFLGIYSYQLGDWDSTLCPPLIRLSGINEDAVF